MRDITLNDVADHIASTSHAMDVLHEITWADVGDSALHAVMAFAISKTKPGGAWALLPDDIKLQVVRLIAEAMVAQHFVDKRFFDSEAWEDGEEPTSSIDEHPAYADAMKRLITADAFSP